MSIFYPEDQKYIEPSAISALSLNMDRDTRINSSVRCRENVHSWLLALNIRSSNKLPPPAPLRQLQHAQLSLLNTSRIEKPQFYNF